MSREQESAEEWKALPRDYDQVSRLSKKAMLDMLEDRLRDYDAQVTRVADVEVAGAVRTILNELGTRPVLIPQGFPQQWLPTGIDLIVDAGLSPLQLDAFAIVLTTATVAIAQTGTLVLQAVPGQGRRAATLVPDVHLCVLRATDIVENVPQAFERLAASAELPTTFVSGPSATADIEMNRIKGVHGPRFLHVILVADAIA